MYVWIAFAIVGFLITSAILAQGTLRARHAVVVQGVQPPRAFVRNFLVAGFVVVLGSVLWLLFLEPEFLVILLAVMLPSWTALMVRKGLPQIYAWYVADAVVLGLAVAIILRETVFS